MRANKEKAKRATNKQLRALENLGYKAPIGISSETAYLTIKQLVIDKKLCKKYEIDDMNNRDEKGNLKDSSMNPHT